MLKNNNINKNNNNKIPIGHCTCALFPNISYFSVRLVWSFHQAIEQFCFRSKDNLCWTMEELLSPGDEGGVNQNKMVLIIKWRLIVSKLYVVFGTAIWVSKNWSQSCEMSRSEDNGGYKELIPVPVPNSIWYLTYLHLCITPYLTFLFNYLCARFYGLICSVDFCKTLLFQSM